MSLSQSVGYQLGTHWGLLESGFCYFNDLSGWNSMKEAGLNQKECRSFVIVELVGIYSSARVGCECQDLLHGGTRKLTRSL